MIDAFVDSIPQEVLFDDKVATTGRPLSHPAIMLKILLFAYSRQTYSGRKIELMLKENLPMRWLARNHTYSYHTINNFRQSQHANNLIKRSFVYFTMALKDHGLIQSDAFFIDGTKLEADANKYSFTWRRAVEKYHAKLKEKTIKLYEDLVEKRVVKAMSPESKVIKSGSVKKR